MTPTTALISNLIRQCQTGSARVCFPESSDIRILQAASLGLAAGAFKRVTLFSPHKNSTLDFAANQGVDLRSFEQQLDWSTDTYPQLEENTYQFVKETLLSKHKSPTDEDLSCWAKSPLVQSTYLLANKHVDASVAGAVYTTREVIKAGLLGINFAKNCRTLSGSFIMNREDGDSTNTYIFGDAGVLIDPTAEQLVDVAAECVRTWQTVLSEHGEPVVAFLSFSTKGSAKHPMAEKMALATRLFQEKFPEIASDGEMQFDAAIDQSIGEIKAPNSPAAGRANIFIFPNLDAGNIAYKITQRLAAFEAFGPILQGFEYPFCDLSRGASAEDVAAAGYISILRSRAILTQTT